MERFVDTLKIIGAIALGCIVIAIVLAHSCIGPGRISEFLEGPPPENLKGARFVGVTYTVSARPIPVANVSLEFHEHRRLVNVQIRHMDGSVTSYTGRYRTGGVIVNEQGYTDTFDLDWENPKTINFDHPIADIFARGMLDRVQ